MKTQSSVCWFLRAVGCIAALCALTTVLPAAVFSGYDEIVPAAPPGVLTVVDGTGRTLPTNRSYVIGIEGGTRGCIEFRNWIGTAQFPIVIVNRHGTGRVVVTDSTGLDTTPTADGIAIINSLHVQLRGDNDPTMRYGIEIAKVGRQYSGRRGLHITGASSYVEAMFLEIHHSEFAGIMAKQDPMCSASWTWASSGLRYDDIWLHDNYVHDTGGECFYIGFTAWDKAVTPCGAWGHEIFGLKIYNNLIERGGWDGLQVGSARSGTEIYNNVIYDNGKIVSTDSGNSGLGVQIGAGTSGLFYNNVVIKSRKNNLNLFGAGNNILFNNLFADAGGAAVFIDNRPEPVPAGQPADRQTQPGSPYYLFNNTIIRPASHGLWTMSQVTDTQFKNNIIIVEGTNDFTRYEGGATGLSAEAGNVMQRDTTGLNFVDETAKDFRIAGGVAADVGVTLAQVPTDFQGLPRPQGSAFDAGFSESGALSVYLHATPPSVGVNDGAITAVASGGTPPYTYTWAHGPTGATVVGLAPGLYSVTATDNTGATRASATYLFAGAGMGAPVALTPPSQVQTPTFSPAPGTYTTGQSVALSSATAGASIRYTLDGSTPTSSTGTLYSGTIAMSTTGTIKAIAYKSGLADSTVAIGTYFIGTPPSAPTGTAVTVSDRRTYFTWNAVAGANRYEVKRALSSGGPYTLQTVVKTNSFTDYGLTNGTTYYYRVAAASEYGTSGDSATASGTPVPFPAPIEILTPVGQGTASGSAFCSAAGAFDEQPTWDSATQMPTAVVSGAGSSTSTAYSNRFWYIDFGANFTTLHITEMWTRYRWSSGGDQPGFAGFWWDDNNDTVNNGITETRMNFGSAQDLESSGDTRLWARDRDFGASPITPPKRYLLVSVGPAPGDRANEFVFVGYRDAAPAITTQPQSQSVTAGANVTFSVAATGFPAPTYQWRKNGTAIAGATGTSYAITNAQAANAGTYEVVVTNSAGFVVSNPASLTVNTITILTPAAWGQATGSGFCSAAGAFNEQPTWDAVAGAPSGISAAPHSPTNTAYSNRFWYVDFGPNYATLRITQMWTRYRPNSSGNFSGFAAVWWDDDIDTVNDGTSAGTMNFQTGQGLPNTSAQLWVKDRDYTSAPITPPSRYLVFSTGATITDRPNEFAFIGYTVP